MSKALPHPSQEAPGDGPRTSTLVASVRLWVPSAPLGQPRQRQSSGAHGQGRNYLPQTHPIHAYKAILRLTAQQQLQRQGMPLPLYTAGPVALWIETWVPRPKRRTTKRGPNLAYPQTRKPDYDNVAKAITDALQGIWWQDDAQITWCLIAQWVCGDGDTPGVLLEVAPHTGPVGTPATERRSAITLQAPGQEGNGE